MELALDAALIQKLAWIAECGASRTPSRDEKGLKAGYKSQKVWFYLSRLPPEDDLLTHTIRVPWAIENQAHWVLDIVSNEDRCRTRRDHSPYNLALLRGIALNLIRQHQGKTRSKP